MIRGARAMRVDSVGFACFQMAILALLGLMLHVFEIPTAAGQSAARALGGAALFLAPFFPLFAVVSPEPANGAKLLVFSAAFMLAIAPWLPAPWLDDEDGGSSLARIFLIATLGNFVLILVPPVGETAPRHKSIRWGSGGKTMAAIAAIALGAAVLDRLRPIAPAATQAYRFVAVALLVILGFFLQTRFTTSPAAIALGWLGGLAAAAACVAAGPVAPRGYVGFTDQAIAGVALGFGAVYAMSHVARNGSAVWAAIALVLSLGSARACPPVTVGLVPALAALALSALLARRLAPALVGALAAAPAALMAWVTLAALPKVLSDASTRPASGAFGFVPESGILGMPWFTALVAIAAVAGLARARFEAAGVALLLFSLGLLVASRPLTSIRGVLAGGAVLGFVLLAAALASMAAPARDAAPQVGALG